MRIYLSLYSIHNINTDSNPPGGTDPRPVSPDLIGAAAQRLPDFWSVAGRPAPRNGKGRGGGVREIDRRVTVLAERGAGKTARGIADGRGG